MNIKIIECIDNTDSQLTVEKQYPVIKESGSRYTILDDDGNRSHCLKSMFKLIKSQEYTFEEVIANINKNERYETTMSIFDITAIDKDEYNNITIFNKGTFSNEVSANHSMRFRKIEQFLSFEEARKEYRDNKKTIQSCVSERIFKNGIDAEIGFSEIEGQWIIID